MPANGFKVWRANKYGCYQGEVVCTPIADASECLARVHQAQPTQHSWPATAHTRYAEGFANTILTDNINFSAGSIVVVSEPLQRILTESARGRFEFLPLSIRNLEDEVVSEEYAVLNVLEERDVLDREASELAENRGRIQGLYSMVLDPAKVPDDVDLFKITGYGDAVLIHPGLAKILDAAGLSGLALIACSDWDGF